MAPRRNNSTHSGVDVHNLLGLSDSDHNFETSSNSSGGGGGGGGGGSSNNVNGIGGGSSLTTSTTPTTVTTTNGHHQQQQQQHTMSNSNGHHQMNGGENFARCCVPTGDCFKSGAPDFGLINLDDLSECVRVICNNESCTAGQYMHRECFESWEQGVLTSLKSIGRARSWSDRQRAQNLWTKKGYDLVFKACGCKCSRGHLKKDLDWVPPTNNNIFGRADEESAKKKKKRNRNNQKPSLVISTTNPGSYHPNSQINNNGILTAAELRGRTGSLSSSNGSTSPPVSASSEQSISPVHNINLAPGGKKQQINQQQHHHQQQQQQQHSQLQQQQQQQLKSKVEIYSERVR